MKYISKAEISILKNRNKNKNKTHNPLTKLSAFLIESENIVRKIIQSATTIPPYLTINLNMLLNTLSIGLSIPVPPYNNLSNDIFGFNKKCR